MTSGEQSVANLGQKLRDARVKRNLSLREVARRVGLTPSLISQIERGQAKPSVGSLYAIASELGLSMDYFFENGDRSSESPVTVAHPAEAPAAGTRAADAYAHDALDGEPDAGSPVVRSGERRTVKIAGGVQWQRLTPRQDHAVEFIEIRYDVGAASSEIAYRHQGREYGVLVSGRLLVELGFEEYLLEPGDSISFNSSMPHRLVNAGDEPVVGIWLILDRI